MTLRAALLSLIFVGASFASAAAQSNDEACRPDVRRLCSKVRRGASDGEYLACLQDHRSSLSASCRRVLERNGK